MATILLGCRGGILVHIIPHGQIINSDLYIQTLKNLAKAFQESSTSQRCCWNPPAMWQCTIIHKFKNVGSNHRTWMHCFFPPTIQPRYWSFRFEPLWSPQRRHPWKVWQWGRGYLKSEEAAASTKSNLVQKRVRCPCFSLAQGSWSWWRLCTKIKCVMQPPTYPISRVI